MRSEKLRSKTFSSEQLSRTGNLDATLILSQNKLDLKHGLWRLNPSIQN